MLLCHPVFYTDLRLVASQDGPDLDPWHSGKSGSRSGQVLGFTGNQ